MMMGSLAGFSPLLQSGLSFSKHEQQGAIFNIPRSRRRVLASRSDAEKAAKLVAASGHMKRKDKPLSAFRRGMLALLAFSASPLFALGSEGAEAPVADRRVKDLTETSKIQKSELLDSASSPQQQNTIAEFKDENKSKGSVLFGFLNEIGIMGSGILGALYWLDQKEKVAAESTIEAVTAELKENEVALASLRENLERRILQEQDKSQKEARKAAEEQAVLSRDLISAKSMATGLEKQLEREKNIVQELEAQVEKYKSEIMQVQKDNTTLETELEDKRSTLNELEEKVKLTNINVQEKEKEISRLNFALTEREKNYLDISLKAEQTRKSLLQAEAQIEELKQWLGNAKNDLHTKELSLKDLNDRLATAVVQKKDTEEKLVMLQEELNQMKRKFDKDLASVRQAFFAKQEEVNQLKEKLDLAYEEDNRNKGIVAGLQEDKSSLEALLEDKKAQLKHLNGELQRSVESLEISKSHVATLSSDLATSQHVKAQLESEIARLQNERDAIRTALEKRVHEEQQISSKLSTELASIKKALDTSKNELLLLNKKLKETTASYEIIKEELSQVYKTAETTFAALNDEKKVTAALSSKLEASERTLSEEKEDKRMLQRDFEEATKSMEDMRNCIMSLSEELEIAKSKIDTLAAEKVSLYESLEEQKQLAEEIQEGAEHANKILMRLGKEKDAYLKKAKKLEEELSSAKGEILRLRKQIIRTNNVSREAHQQKEKGNETKVGKIWTNTVSGEVQQQKETEQTKSKQSHDNDRHLTDVSQQIENMQAELSQIQKKLGDADQDSGQPAGTKSLLNDGIHIEKPSQDTVSVAPVSAQDTDK